MTEADASGQGMMIQTYRDLISTDGGKRLQEAVDMKLKTSCGQSDHYHHATGPNDGESGGRKPSVVTLQDKECLPTATPESSTTQGEPLKKRKRGEESSFLYFPSKKSASRTTSDERIRGLYDLLAPARVMYRVIHARFQDHELFQAAWKLLMSEWDLGEQLEISRYCYRMSGVVGGSRVVVRKLDEIAEKKWDQIAKTNEQNGLYCHGTRRWGDILDGDQKTETWELVGKALVATETIKFSAKVIGIGPAALSAKLVEHRAGRIVRGYHDLRPL